MHFLTQNFIYKLFAFGFAVTLVARLAKNRRLQPELAIRDLGFALLLMSLAHSRYESDFAIASLLVMSLCLFCNSVAALRRNHRNAWTLAGAAVNFLGLALVVSWALFSGK